KKSSQWIQQAVQERHIEFIPYDSFTKHEEIARGAYGEVTKAYWPTAEKTVALKSLFDNYDSEAVDDKDFDDFVKEIKLIRSVHFHDNVIRVFGISQDPATSRYFMVLQYADGGSLRDYLQKNFKTLDWKKKISMGKQIASGLKLSGTGSTSVLTGMFAYLEPQCFIDPKYQRDKASDIYSLGVLLWEISSGRIPFDDQNIFDISNKVKNGEREKPVDGTPDDYRMVYERAWSQNPKDRQDINEVKEKLEEMLSEGKKGDNSIGSLTNNMNALNTAVPKSPFNQPNNNANKRFSQNNVPPTYQPGGFNPNFGYNGNIVRSNTDPNLMQNYTPQPIYQPMTSYANNNVIPQRPLIPQYTMNEAHNTNMNQGMVAAAQQQQFPNNASNVKYSSGMNNHFQQQPLYPTVNAGQSQTYPNINQHLMPNNFNNNQQQFKPIVHSPSNMNAQPMTPSNMNVQSMTPSNMNVQSMTPSNMNVQSMTPSNMNVQSMTP
ncbi:11765_t:CDS:2, partial [Cetraspora pellucida]